MNRLSAMALFLAAACGPVGEDESSSDDGLPPDALVLADGVQVDGISIFQGTEVELMHEGALADPASQVPVITGRNAMARVFVSHDADYNHEPVVARLTIGKHQLEISKAHSSISSKFSFSSTFNFDIAGDLLHDADHVRVELLQTHSQSRGNNQQAQSEILPLGSRVPGRTLKLLFLPIIYGTDGSHRAPDTSEEQMLRYRDAFMATYPVSDVEVTVGEPITTQTHLAPEGAGWDELLDEMLVVRAERAIPNDTYLYGLINPSDTQQTYCEYGCILGNSYLNESGAAELRASIGLGFNGSDAVAIAVHELGHQHGRPHAPCEVPDPDPAYPYAEGKIGRWGYDPRSQSLMDPHSTADLMGYCAPAWISDYTFGALLDRITQVSASGSDRGAPSTQQYQMMRVTEQGQLIRGTAVRLPTIAADRLTNRRGTLDGQSVSLSGHFIPYSHVPGGVFLVP